MICHNDFMGIVFLVSTFFCWMFLIHENNLFFPYKNKNEYIQFIIEMSHLVYKHTIFTVKNDVFHNHLIINKLSKKIQ